MKGSRLVNEKDEMKNGKSNGQKITTWMIKYPHIKKNAQQYKTHYYPASRPLSTSMYDWLINIILGILITLLILTVVQMGYNFLNGVY